MKVSDLMTGRNDGLLMAYKIAKEGGIEALEKEIRYRNISGISLNLTQKEIKEASYTANLRATEVAITISLLTLMDEFCFSKFQANKFKDSFDRKVEDVLNNDSSLEEYLTRIRNELNIELVVKD
jgi:hypothetical protein